ncbi:molybdopterin-dependent oxidoreductase [Imbroritus primus]|uniref:molybdopterin-dependent oxidoreductase n=1 Tax=Imbroritus primus TaxID=3058603 RepID=UPI003D161A3F
MTQLALSIDLERCTGCKSCEAACKQVNGLGPQEYRNKVLWLGAPDVPQLDFLTVTCQQCERPACVRACPVAPKALSKDPVTGVVSVNEARCTGCGECVLACPYGAMGYDPVDHHAVKCDLCAPRRARGDGPACASVCPTRAITFGVRDALLEAAASQGKPVRDHDHFLQGPATLYLDRKPAPQVMMPDAIPVAAPATATNEAITPARMPDRLAHTLQPAILNDHRPRARLSGTDTAFPYRHDNSAAPERVTPGGCHICFNGCTVKFHHRDGQIVNILGNTDDPVFQGRICPKSQMTLQLYRNPGRLTHPLKRVGPRGSGRFERIGWDQALDEIAARLRAVRDQHGSEALAIHMGTRTGVLNIMGYMRLFAQLWGTPNVLTTEPLCDAGKVVALELTLGSTNLGNIYTPDDIGSAQLYVYFGDNQAETRPVNFGMLNDWRLRNGARLVVADPRLTPTASKADVWLPIRPGTDMALGLALIHEIFVTNQHDAAFCADWVLGWERWREFILTQGYSPEWAAAVTGLDARQIRALAAEIATADGCMIYASRGVNQHSNSLQTNRVLMFLAAITGNWGRKGGGYFNVAAEPDWQTVPVPDARRATMTRPAMGRSPVAWLDGMLHAQPYPIRALITGNNPAAQWPGGAKVREALEALDLIVHVELFQNATSALADYVLPAATGIEKGGISRLSEDRRIVWNDKLIEPPGEARSDHWFWIELGKRLGYDDVLQERYKDPGTFWDEVFRPATPDLHGATLKRLRGLPHRWVRTPVAHEDAPEAGTLYLDGSTAFGQPAGKRFPTPSGKLEFWTESLEAKFRALGLSALPEFYTEAEQLVPLPWLPAGCLTDGDGEITTSPFFHAPALAPVVDIAQPDDSGTPGTRLRDAGYDTELVTGRPAAPHFHSWTHYFWQAQEMWPELYCQMHPDKAAAIGVRDGERVRIDTPRGSVEARAWVTTGIRRESVFVPIGWDQTQPFHPAASVNMLTEGKLDPASQQSNLKLHLCKVRAVAGT